MAPIKNNQMFVAALSGLNFLCDSKETVQQHIMSVSEVEFKTTRSVFKVRIRGPLSVYGNASNPFDVVAERVYCTLLCKHALLP